jgi:site-specific recombinase
MGYTLATKQPAMTASTLAISIHKNSNNQDYSEFGNLFVRLFRSQFIAFIGNVLMAFPVALTAGYLFLLFTGENPVKQYKAESLLHDLNPFLSLALFHASIAGFYLFLSGLISGYYINNNIHKRISYRYRKHPFLRNLFPENILNKFADFYDKKIGGISGNFWFGIFLGSTGVVGYFIGIPIDIRHITFAAGNFALALVGLEFNVSVPVVLISILCIGLIGFFNFIVSFTLSLFLAMRSRKTPLKNLKLMYQSVLKIYRENPGSFFYPPANQGVETEKKSKSVLKEDA